MEKTRILITDDNQEFCDILSKFLSKDDDFQVVGVARNGLEALDKIVEEEPD
ncbi:MAG: sporulation transcription factor Spo0A, partial [Tissierellia bacterium]|nr:sporulation transcription factor Spo0A [Tissierellia bacterium]